MRHTIRFSLAGLILAASSSSLLSADLDRENVDVERYVLDYALSLDAEDAPRNSLSGSVTIRFRNKGPKAIDAVPIVLNRLMRYESAHDGEGRELEIRNRLVEMANFEYYQANAGVVALASAVESGAVAELRLTVGGRLTGYVETGMMYTRESLDPEFTILRSEVLPFPQIAEPDWLEVRKAWADDFDWQATFDVPATHQVANGESVRIEEKGGRRLYHYKSSRPSSFLVFPIAPYGELKVGANRIFHLPGSEAGAQRLAGNMVKALALYEEWFGPLNVQGGLALIEIPEGYGSQAKFPTIIQTADAFNSAESMDQLYHELSHLWGVEKYEPQAPRLEEGLSTFLQALVDVKLGGGLSLEEFMASVLGRQQTSYERSPEYRDIAVADFGREGVTGLSYGVGALFYYELYQVLGEEQLIAFLRGFYDAHKDDHADFDTLVDYYRRNLEGDAAQVVEEWLIGTAYVEKITAN
jgi:hypothetical protein